jgi:hypothetical protein
MSDFSPRPHRRCIIGFRPRCVLLCPPSVLPGRPRTGDGVLATRRDLASYNFFCEFAKNSDDANAVRPTRVSLTTTESRTRPPLPTHRANLTITEPSECERDGSQLPHQRHVVLGYRRDRPPHSRIGTRGLTLISTLPAFISPFSLPFILLPTPDAKCPSRQGAPSNFGTEGATCNIDDAFGRRRTTYNTSRGNKSDRGESLGGPGGGYDNVEDTDEEKQFGMYSRIMKASAALVATSERPPWAKCRHRRT